MIKKKKKEENRKRRKMNKSDKTFKHKAEKKIQ